MLRTPRYLWFKFSLLLGAMLGVLLLVQSIAGYIYVSQRLVREQLRRDTDRRAVMLEREARATPWREPADLVPVLDEFRQDTTRRIAWIRLLDPQGRILAQSGEPVAPPFPAKTLRAMFEDRQDVSAEHETPEGKVVVHVVPFRAGRPPRPPEQAAAPQREAPPPEGESRRRTGLMLIEIAQYMDAATGAFARLRRNLIVSTSAAVALLASMALFFFRFPAYLRAKQTEQQLDLARHVQQDLLPSSEAGAGSLDLAAACVPASQVGGDLYDVFPDGDDRVALLVGDVAGKGLPAALLMGVLHGAIRSSRWLESGADHEASSRRLNELLCARTSQERFVSLFWGHYDAQRAVLSYVNAGHLPPMLVSPNGGHPDVRLLDEGGPVLGLLPKAQYRQGCAAMRPGDVLVVYSDGLVEAANSSEEEFGEERLRKTVMTYCAGSAEEIRNAVLEEVKRFVGGQPLGDDLTLLVVRPKTGKSAHLEAA